MVWDWRGIGGIRGGGTVKVLNLLGLAVPSHQSHGVSEVVGRSVVAMIGVRYLVPRKGVPGGPSIGESPGKGGIGGSHPTRRLQK